MAMTNALALPKVGHSAVWMWPRWVGMLTVLSAGFWIYAARSITAEPPRGDAIAYTRMAYHLANANRLSTDRTDDSRAASLTAYREPLWPFVLSLAIPSSPKLRDVTLSEIREATNHAMLLPMRLVGFSLLYVTAMLTGVITMRFARHPVLFIAGFAAIASNTDLFKLADAFYSEPLILPLLLTISIFLARAVRSPRRKDALASAAAAGLAMGLLTLTRATFQFFPIVLVPLWLLHGWWLGRVRASAATIVAFILAFAIPVGGWVARNYVEFNALTVAQRGGEILALRVGYDQMTGREYAAALFYYAPVKSLRRAGQRWLGDDAFTRLDRNNPDGFYRQSREEGKSRMRDGQVETGRRTEAENQLVGDSVRWILTHPFKHLAVSFPLALQGIPPTLSFWTLGSAAAFAVFLVVSAGAFIRRRAELAFAMLPALFLLAFNIFLTHNISRYNVPCIPFCCCAAAIAAMALWRRWLEFRTQNAVA